MSTQSTGPLPARPDSSPLPRTSWRWSRRMLDRFLGALYFIGEFASVLARGLTPGRWRRTMRSEFWRYFYKVGFGAVPAVLIAGLMVGVGLVLQVIYWLAFAGQGGRIGDFLVLALVRQIAPITTALIVIGRSGAAMVDEIGQLQRSGHLNALRSHGIAPTDLITIPRCFAVALALVVLTNLFLHTALWSGYLAASAAGLALQSPAEFAAAVLGMMRLGDHVLLLIKPLLIGYTVAYLSIWFGTHVAPGPEGIREALPRAFVASLIATLVIGASVTAML